MSPKRKAAKQIPDSPTDEYEWDIAEQLKSDPLFLEIAEELLHPKELEKEEKIEADIGDLFDTLCNPVSESEEITEFEIQWERFLNLNVALATREFIAAGIPKEKVERLIVYGWASFDRQSDDIRFRFGPPLDGSDAAKVILVFRDASWRPPAYVEAAVWRHPSVRNATGEDVCLDWRGQFLQRLEWAKSLPDQSYSAQRLREISSAITDMLYVPKNPDPLEEGWISSAKKSTRFWAILSQAINFGLHQNTRNLFLDGKLLKSTQRSALNDKVENLSWFLIIEETMREEFLKTDQIVTPSNLRRLFDSLGIPGDDRVILEFRDLRFVHHGKITWGMFKKYAKQAGKIGSDHQTQ